MASESCKQWVYQHGLYEPHYRLLYSVIAVFTAGVWVFYVHQLPDTPLYQTDGLLWAAMVFVQVLGLAVALAAFQPIDGLVFIGLHKAKSSSDPFIECGIYRRLRHPMYSGAMLVLLAMPEQTWNGLHVTLLVCVYFIVGARFEEQRMIAQHPDYLAYRKRVPAFIPHFWKRY